MNLGTCEFILDFNIGSFRLKNISTGKITKSFSMKSRNVTNFDSYRPYLQPNMCESKVIGNYYHARCAYDLMEQTPLFPIYRFSQRGLTVSNVTYSISVSKTVISANVFLHPNVNFGQTKTSIKLFSFRIEDYKNHSNYEDLRKCLNLCCKLNFTQIDKRL